MDLPTLQAITTRTWGKEDELKALKAELATLDKKITSELAPKQEKQDFGEEIKSSTDTDEAIKETEPKKVEEEQISKSIMVAEPPLIYTAPRIHIRS